MLLFPFFFFFFSNDTATTEIYTLSLHDALPISEAYPVTPQDRRAEWTHGNTVAETADGDIVVSFRNISTVVTIERSEEHTSELQSPCNLVCRLLLEKKKKIISEQARRITC